MRGEGVCDPKRELVGRRAHYLTPEGEQEQGASLLPMLKIGTVPAAVKQRGFVSGGTDS